MTLKAPTIIILIGVLLSLSGCVVSVTNNWGHHINSSRIANDNKIHQQPDLNLDMNR